MTWTPPRGRLLVWSAAVLVAAVLAAAVLRDDRGPVGDLTVGDVARVGVTEGDSIPDYVRASRDELAGLLASGRAETYALVSFATYLDPYQLGSVLDGVSVSEVVTRVPLPATQTEIVRIPATRVPDDVVAGMTRIAERKEREAREYRERSAQLAGAEELRRIYDSNARVADEEAAAYRSSCACVYAAVVRATPSALDEIARRPKVRVVDPAPEVHRLDRAVFLPPLPEQEDVVRPPADERLSGRTPDQVESGLGGHAMSQ